MALQYLLNDNGASLPAIGSYGSRTSAAVKRFQLTHHLGESGQADGRTLAALVKPLSAGVGVSNTVKALQTLLNKAGASLPVTGVFGSQTQTALATVKKKAKLSATATADPATWAYLFSIKPATPKGGNWQACTKAINAGLPIQKTAVAKNGARVAACLVANMNLMIDAAARSGITLKTNSAWRSRADQVALRKQNCGTTQYSIYKMPQARCKPPTAIPGTSIHELGLAIDLKNSQVGTPTYTWMKQYGKYFGFRHTVATEPWHWDTKQREVKG